jgi:hypothetical protein
MEIAGVGLIGVGGFLAGWRWSIARGVFGVAEPLPSPWHKVEIAGGLLLMTAGLGLLFLVAN